MYLDLHIGYQLMIEKESVFNLQAKKCLSSIPLSNVTLPERNYNSHYGNGVPAMFTS